MALLPAVLLVGAVLWQLALAGQAAWLTANAARVAARAEAVGRDGTAAARSALPRSLERGLLVRRTRSGAVRVEARIPLIGGLRSPLSISSTASLGRPAEEASR